MRNIYNGKRITHLEEMIIVNAYVLYNKISKHMMKILAEFKTEIENFINIFGDLINLFQQLMEQPYTYTE